MNGSLIDPTVGTQTERKEGEIIVNDALSLGMTDEEIVTAIGSRLTDSEKFWNSQLNLDAKSDRNEQYWLGSYFDTSKLYDFQVPYKDNRIFVSIETVIPLALARPPQPICIESYDTEASRELAHNIEKWLLGKYEDLYLKGKFMMVARHLLIGYRRAVMKRRWDTSIGMIQEDGSRYGDIAIEVKRPQRVVIDAGAQDIDEIPFIGEYLTATIDDLCNMYPKKKDDICKASGHQEGVSMNMNKRVGYVESWFDFYKDGKSVSACAWKYHDVVLDSMKNPERNYDEYETDASGKQNPLNFFDKPKKPYTIFNFLNLGRWVIDDTSLTDQAGMLQEILDKRGRQIVENADQANAGMVLNADMIKATEVAKLLGDPGEKVLVKGDVRMAATRLPINILPEYVMADKIDARNEIDNMYGTHGAVRGEVTKSKTLGQDVLSQRGDSSRITTLATAIEDGADRLYKGMVQMAKVYYDIPQLQRYSSPDGSTMFGQFGREQIEPGVAVRVKTGSVLPEDRLAKREETVEMLPILDPLSIAEGLNKENPTEFAKRLLYYRVFPDRYMKEILKVDPTGAGTDPSAEQEIQLLNSGQSVPPQQNPTKQHLATHQAFMEAPQFQQLDPVVQKLHVVHVQAEADNAKNALGMQERPGMPPSQQTPQQTGTPPGTGTPSETSQQQGLAQAGSMMGL